MNCFRHALRLVPALIVLIATAHADMTDDLRMHMTFDGSVPPRDSYWPDDSWPTYGANNQGKREWESPHGSTYGGVKVGADSVYLNVGDQSDAPGNYDWENFIAYTYNGDWSYGSGTDFTIAMWIWLRDSWSGGDPAIMSNTDWSSSGNRGWTLFYQRSDSGIGFNINWGGGHKVVTNVGWGWTSSPNWKHVLVSVDRDATSRIFWNGSQVNTFGASNGGSIDTGRNINLGQDGGDGGFSKGAFYNWGNDSFAIFVDDVAMWRRALNATEAGLIYTGGNANRNIQQLVPFAPTGPSYTNVSETSIRWTWTSNDGSPYQSGFRVYTGSGSTAPAGQTATTTNNYFDYTGLTRNNLYAFQVAAYGTAGTSAKTGNINRYTMIEAVSSLTFDSRTNDQIRVFSFNTPSNLAGGSSGLYFENLTQGTNSGWQQNNNGWFSTGLSPNTQYTFRGRSRNGNAIERGTVSAGAWTLANVPDAPTVGSPTPDALDVSVNVNGNPAATQFAIYCVTTGQWVQANGTLSAGEAWQTAANWNNGGATTVSPLNPLTTYQFRVKARNGINEETVLGATGQGTTSVNAPNAPGNPTATILDSGTIRWGWSDNSNNETGFKVWVDPGAGQPTTLRHTTAAGALDWTHSGLAANQLYTMQVAATNTGGDSARVPGAPGLARYTAIEEVPGLSFSNIQTDSIDVVANGTFSALTAGSSGLLYELSGGGNSGWVQTLSPQTFGTLSVNTQYTFSGKSRNGDGLETSETSAVKWTLANAPVAPTVSNPQPTTLDVAIGAGDGNPALTQYAIRCESTGQWVQNTGALGASEYWDTAAGWGTVSVTGLAERTSYNFQIKARNGEAIPTALGPLAGGTTTSSDTTSPNCTLATSAPDPTNTAPIPFTASWNEDVFGFVEGDISVVGGSVTGGSFTNTTPNRAWSFSVTPAGADVAVDVVVPAGSAQDIAANPSLESNTISLQYDSVPPSAPSTPDLTANDDTGTSSSDNLTNQENSLTFTGTAEADATVTIYIDGAPSAFSGLAGGGAYSIDVDLPSSATYLISAIATDPAGNASGESAPLAVTVDTAAPAAPSTPDLDPADDSGALNDDDLTNTTGSLTLIGTAEANAIVRIYNGSTELSSATATATGDYAVEIDLGEGTHDLTATAEDTAGNEGGESAALTLNIDTTPPPAPTIPDLEDGDDSGDSNSDDLTNQTTGLTFSGTAEPDSTVRLYRGAALLGSAATVAGSFSIEADLAAGMHDLSAAATDLAGNEGPRSGALTVTVDNVAPSVLAVSVLGPLQIQVQFDKPMSSQGASHVLTPGNYAVSGDRGSLAVNPDSISNLAGNSYVLTWLTGEMVIAGDLTITVTGVVDTVGNAIGVTNSATDGNGGQGIAPTVTQVAVTGPRTVEVTFSEPMGAGVTGSGNYTLSGSGRGTLTDSPTTVTAVSETLYRLRWSAGEMTDGGDITITANNVADLVTNEIGTPNAGTDVGGALGTPPTVSATNPALDAVVSALPEIEVTFSEPVAGIGAAALTVNGSPATTVTGSGAGPYAFIGYADPADGTVNAAVAAGSALDLADNPFAGFNWTFTRDSALVSIDLATSDVLNGGATNMNPVLFVAQCSEPVQGFTAGDITVTSGSVEGASFTAVAPDRYTFNVIPAGQGGVQLRVPTAVCQAVAAPFNPNGDSNTFLFNFDSVQPSVQSIAPITTGPTNIDSMTFTVSFTEPVLAFDSADDLVISDGGTSYSAVIVVGGPQVFTVTLTGLTGDGLLNLEVDAAAGVTDVAGNALFSGVQSGPGVVIDNTGPTGFIISVPPATPNPLSSMQIQFSEPVRNFNLADLRLTLDGASTVTLSSAALTTGNGRHWTLSGLEGVTATDGDYAMQLMLGDITDLAGNPMTSGGFVSWTKYTDVGAVKPDWQHYD